MFVFWTVSFLVPNEVTQEGATGRKVSLSLVPLADALRKRVYTLFILTFCSRDLGASSKWQYSVLQEMPSHLQGPHMSRGVRWDRFPPLGQAVFVSGDLSETRGKGPLPAGAQRRLKDDILTELGLETKVWREQEEKVEEPRRRPHRKQPGVGKGAGPVLVWKGSGTTWEWEMTSEDFFKKINTVLAEIFFKRKE